MAVFSSPLYFNVRLIDDGQLLNQGQLLSVKEYLPLENDKIQISGEWYQVVNRAWIDVNGYEESHRLCLYVEKTSPLLTPVLSEQPKLPRAKGLKGLLGMHDQSDAVSDRDS